MDKRHPIQVVAKRTGLSADVLRAWEKRYGILDPARSDGGRRLYSDEDIDYLRMLRRATAAGRNVGQLVALSRADLEALIREDETAATQVPVPARTVSVGEATVERAVAAMVQLDGQGLDAILRRAMIENDAQQFLGGVVVPLLTRIGERWAEGDVDPAHEHLASSVIRGVLGEFTATFVPGDGAPRLLAATPTGQRHEFGAMLVAAGAASAGWRVTYLGSDLPAASIAKAARQSEAGVVALSIVHPKNDQGLAAELRALRAALASDVVLLVGGAAAESYGAALRAVQALVVRDIAALRSTLGTLALERRPRS